MPRYKTSGFLNVKNKGTFRWRDGKINYLFMEMLLENYEDKVKRQC